MNDKTQDLVVLFCPSLSKYPKQPSDQSLCKLIDCPDCKESMGLSQKKEEVMTIAEAAGKEILLACYICFEKMVRKNPVIMKRHILVNL